jgi:hypothetical protein
MNIGDLVFQLTVLIVGISFLAGIVFLLLGIRRYFKRIKRIEERLNILTDKEKKNRS